MATDSGLRSQGQKSRNHDGISPGEQTNHSSQRFENVQTSDHARLHMGNSYTTYVYNPAALVNSVPTAGPDDPVHVDFVNACSEGQRQARLNYLIRKGANIDHRDQMQGTPLHHAAFAGHADIVRYLLDAGADINAAGDWVGTPIGLAAVKGHMAVVEVLLAHRASLNRCSRYVGTAIHMACAAGRLDILLLLYQSGARLDAQVACCTRIYQSFARPYHKFLSSSRAYNLIPNIRLDVLFGSPGAVAAWIGHIDIVRWLLEQPHGLQLHERADFAITTLLPSRLLKIRWLYKSASLVMLAVSTVQLGMLRWIIAKGANITSLDSRQRNAIFWLGVASFEDSDTIIAHSACLSLLLEHGLYIDDRDPGQWTALIYAASHLRLNAARILLDQGACVNASDGQGRTPLMVAVRAGLAIPAGLEFVRFLCKEGADVRLKNAAGLTALDHIGIRTDCEELRAVLLRYSVSRFKS